MTQDKIKQAWEESTGSCWPEEGCFTSGEYDFHLTAFAHKIRNAALEEAAKVADSECDNWDEELSLRICAKSIRSMKS